MKNLSPILFISIAALSTACSSKGAPDTAKDNDVVVASKPSSAPAEKTECPDEQPDRKYRFAVGSSPGYQVQGFGHNSYKCSARFVDSDVVSSNGQHQTLVKAGPFESYTCDNQHPSGHEFMAVEATELRIQALNASNIDVPVGPTDSYELSAEKKGKLRLEAIPYDACGYELSGYDITVIWEPERDCGFTIEWETDYHGTLSVDAVRSGEWKCDVKVSTILADKEVVGTFNITVK